MLIIESRENGGKIIVSAATSQLVTTAQARLARRWLGHYPEGRGECMNMLCPHVSVTFLISDMKVMVIVHISRVVLRNKSIHKRAYHGP